MVGGQLQGFTFIMNPNVYDEVRTQVKRVWKERLFSIPWNPFKKTKTTVQHKPMVLVDVGGRVIYCHPDIADEIIEQLERKG